MGVATELGSLASVLGKLAATPDELLVRGTLIDDQFVIERALGHGAMGVVYLARDRRLDRDVALKLARQREVTTGAREALALARLAHPNVVTVFGVGEHAGRGFVAMEYVAGTTARTWVNDKPARDILALYLAVGDGLAAAHAAGLVHRDFKPDNILVGEDGRGRVADFGLARTPGDGAESALAGTPAYMPPEQARGDVVDARADQFAYCASLWEALYGVREFATPATIPHSQVSRRVEAALRRGMATRADERWPDMRALLAELRRPERRPLRTLAAVLLVASMLVGVGVMVVQREAAPDVCDGGPRIASVWPPMLVGAVFGTDARAAARMDTWVREWTQHYRRVCEDRAWSPALRDRGMACLAQRVNAVDAVARLVGQTPASAIAAQLARLPAPGPCGDAAYLAAQVAPPTDPVLARAVSDRLLAIERIRALALTGKFADARAQQEALEGIVVPDRFAAVHLAATRGLIEQLAGNDAVAVEQLRTAYYEARSIGARVLAAGTASIVVLCMLNLDRHAEAGEWGRLAEVEVAAIADAQLQGRVLTNLSDLATATGDPQRGLALAERAVASAPTHLSLRARAMAHAALGEFTQALADYDRATTQLRSFHGDVHRLHADLDSERALVEKQLGRHDAAVASARRALAMVEQTEGSASDAAMYALHSLATVLAGASQFSEALAMHERALHMTSEGERSFSVASMLTVRAEILIGLRRYADAIAAAEQARAILQEVRGPTATEIGFAEQRIALAHFYAGELAAARAAADRALALLTPDIPSVQLMQLVRTEALIARRDLVAARRELALVTAAYTTREVPREHAAWAERLRAIVDPP